MALDLASETAPPSRVLIADSDAKVLRRMNRALVGAGFAVAAADDVASAMTMAVRERFDLLVLDPAMFGADGLAVCAGIGAQARTPIIVSSASKEEGDIVRALELGADDYVTKPLQERELLARISAVLRRAVPNRADVLAVDDVVLDVAAQLLRRGEALLRLTRLETVVLCGLLVVPGRSVSAERLALDAWGKSAAEQRHALKQTVYRLRRKLENEPGCAGRLETLRGAGYRWRKLGDAV